MWDNVESVRRGINFHLFFSVHIVGHEFLIERGEVWGITGEGLAILPGHHKKQKTEKQ